MTGEDGLRAIRGISSRRVVRPDGVAPGTVLIAGERIEAVVPERLTLPDVIDGRTLGVGQRCQQFQ